MSKTRLEAFSDGVIAILITIMVLEVPMIVITTPTGQIGRQVLGNLLDSGEQLRVIALDPSQLPAEVRDADSGLGGFHADVAGAESFYSDVLGWETGDQPIGAFSYTVMRSADAVMNSDQSGIIPLSRRWQRPELRPGGLRGRRLRCCGRLLRGSLRSCQGHLL